MTPELAAGILGYASGVWPSVAMGEAVVVSWADATPEVDPTTAHTAMRRLARSEDRMPSIARFLTECRLIQRENMQPAIAAGPLSLTDRREAAARIAALRVYWSGAAEGRPDHDHRKGDHACPRCSTSDAWVAEHAPVAMEILREAAS